MVSSIAMSPNSSPDVADLFAEVLQIAICRCEGSNRLSHSAKLMMENLQNLLANIVFGRVLGKQHAALTKYDLIGACALLAGLFESLKTSVAVQQAYKNHNSSLLSLGWVLMQHVQEKSTDLAEKVLGSWAIRYFTKMLKVYFKQLVESEAWEVFEKMIAGGTGSMFDLMSRILLEPASVDNPCIFYHLGIEDIEFNLNKSKSTLIYLFQHFVNLAFSMKVFRDKPFMKGEGTLSIYQPLLTITMKIVESTHLLGKMLPREESCQSCIVLATNYMVKTACEHYFYEVYQKSHKLLIVDLILPHLIITDQEREDFEKNEVEFCSYSLDIVTPIQQNSETPKVRCAKLLVQLSTQIDGCLTFVTQLLFALIEVVSHKMDQQTALTAYPILYDVLNSQMFAKFGKGDILDMCLLTMSILSHQILGRVDLK
jgi:hypothetical protein